MRLVPGAVAIELQLVAKRRLILARPFTAGKIGERQVVVAWRRLKIQSSLTRRFILPSVDRGLKATAKLMLTLRVRRTQYYFVLSHRAYARGCH